MGKEEFTMDDASFEERQTFIGLGISILAIIGYVVAILVIAAGDDKPFTEVSWQIPMLVVVLGGGALFGLSYLISWRRHHGPTKDERDDQIERYSESISGGLTGLTVMVTIILMAIGVSEFWVVHNLFLGAWFASFVGSAAKAAAYQEGIQS